MGITTKRTKKIVHFAPSCFLWLFLTQRKADQGFELIADSPRTVLRLSRDVCVRARHVGTSSTVAFSEGRPHQALIQPHE